jgi:enoyl-[acyl-carrier protein] reductase II
MEAGGHIGELTTMAIVPQVVSALSIPVIAAGGIADGRGVAAVFALGAEGVQLGTRFICCAECAVHANYKQAVLDARDRSTVVTGRGTGHPVRCIGNKLTAEFEKLEAAGASSGEIEKLGIGKLRDGVIDGDTDWGSLMAGQSSAMVNDIRPAKDIIEDIFKEAGEISGKLGALL